MQEGRLIAVEKRCKERLQAQQTLLATITTKNEALEKEMNAREKIMMEQESRTSKLEGDSTLTKHKARVIKLEGNCEKFQSDTTKL